MKLQELSTEELTNVEGGILGLDDLVIGLTVAVVAGVIADWDNFKEGVSTAFN